MPALFVLGAGGSFFGTRALLSDPETAPDQAAGGGSGTAFVPLEPIMINLGSGDSGRFLRFHAQIEVESRYRSEVAAMLPRLVDVLNGYLRAVDIALLEDRTALMRLKAQMLRRLQLVAGTGRIRDLLVMEFIVS